MKQFTEGQIHALKSRYRVFFQDRSTFISIAVSFIFLFCSLIVNYFASQYAFKSKSNHVTDILLDNLPIVQVEVYFITGTILFLLFISTLLLLHPSKIAFVVKSIALFVIVRAIFISLTHIGPSPFTTLSAPGEIGRAFTSGADLFFSGHTGMPFLFALMYWYNKHLRYIFLVSSILAGAGVLLGHIHYSIDVASAFFITYGIYKIAIKSFRIDFLKFTTRH